MAKSKSNKVKFNAAAAYAAPDDDSSMGQSSPSSTGPTASTGASGPSDNDSDDTSASSASSGQPVSFQPDQVAQMEQYKQQGDYQSLGQYVAQYLP